MNSYTRNITVSCTGWVAMVILVLLFPTKLVAQELNLTFSVEKKPLKEVLTLIEKKANVAFFYNDKDVDQNRLVTISVEGQSLQSTLEVLFKSTSNSFRIDKKQVYITQKKILLLENTSSKTRIIQGVVLDETHELLIGAQVVLQGTTTGTITDIDGKFSLSVPENGELQVHYVGYTSQRVMVKGRNNIVITLKESVHALDAIVVVGYGQQKKESLVGAIVQAKGDELARTGVSTSVGQTLSGLLPGVSTTVTTGMPGEEDPAIRIRGLSSWNGSSPLVLIDGVERSMSDIDVGQIESISVLKDASATAVFGVKGAEGVILITTKRGREGKASVSFSASVSFKTISRIPDQLDSYDIFAYQNEVLEKQSPAYPSNWGWYLPQGEINKYRNPSSYQESLFYPNVNWQNEVARDFALTQRYDINITGGTAFAKYFAAISYTKDDDLLKSGVNVGLPYKPKWGFEHYNYRSNIDLNITKTTTFTANLAGSIRQKEGFSNSVSHIWGAFYRLSPAAFPVRYDDGTFGYNENKPDDVNPLLVLSGGSGLYTQYTTQLFSDFSLKQELDFITPGLSAMASLSYDIRLFSSSSISYIDLLAKSVSKDGVINYRPNGGGNDMDYFRQPGTLSPESFSISKTGRHLYYKFQVNYARTFGVHDVSALALMSREETTAGSEFPRYREDWVGRFTYAYDSRYFIEANGAYNGSERFASKYRFGFFPSVGIGWMLSNEQFLKADWLEKLKIRYSIGSVGSDTFYAPRWAYMAGWSQYDGLKATFGNSMTPGDSRYGPGTTYLSYSEVEVGNPDLHWEVSRKQNLGIDLSVFRGILSGSFELFKDDRSDVFLSANNRTVPPYFGAAPVAANVGKVQNQGFEFDFKLQHTWSDWHPWIRYNFMSAKDKVIYAEDPLLRPDYQKSEGFTLNQPRYLVEQPGFVGSWDDLYGSVAYESNTLRQPGDLAMIDYNADGVIDSRDHIAYGYPNRPQNTYNVFFGLDWRGFSFMVQFLGAYNVSQYFSSINFGTDVRAPFANPQITDFWSPSNPTGIYALQTKGLPSGQTRGYFLDASYLRLKTIELAYSLSNKWLKKFKISSMKITASGNNLFLFSKIPDDRESEVVVWDVSSNLYPTLRRFNLGLNITF